MNIVISNLTSDSGLLPSQGQAIARISANFKLIETLGKKVSAMVIKNQTFSFDEIDNVFCKMAAIWCWYDFMKFCILF